jgi:ADP-L-glycero-D-manno-heptose 6-epimerase
MSYIITGAAGFIGSRFVERCQEKSLSLISVDELSAFSNRPELQDLEFGSKIDRTAFLDWLETKLSSRIEAIIHLGAITDTRERNEELLKKYNLEYSKRLWAYATDHKIPFFYASSAATYGDGSFGYDDDESGIYRLRPLNPYGQSKQDFDIWVLKQEERGQCPPRWAGFKFFNVYGFGERHKGFMSSVVLHAFDQILATGEVQLFKSHRDGIPDGFQKRDFIFAEDVIDVLFFAVGNPIKRGIYNLGSGHARTFLDLARATFTALGRPENIRFIDTPLSIRDKYQYFTEAPMARLRACGYAKVFTNLEDGVRQYVERLNTSNKR